MLLLPDRSCCAPVAVSGLRRAVVTRPCHAAWTGSRHATRQSQYLGCVVLLLTGPVMLRELGPVMLREVAASRPKCGNKFILMDDSPCGLLSLKWYQA